jgi:ribosome biogenesis GTPase
VKQTFPARVVSVGKNAAHVVLDSEEHSRVADLKRSSGKREMLAPGDRVQVRILEDGRVLVEAVEPRSVTLQRRTVEGRAKTMAANVDTLATVTALADPPPRLLTLDQLLAFSELEGISALVVLTKPDLADDGATRQLAELYSSLGYETLIVNPKAGQNIDGLRQALARRHALLCGVSGVGKSSIFRALGGDALIGDVSRHGLGRQTTTAARLYRTPDGFLIDSPGVAEFGLGAMTPEELVEGFREMRGFVGRCRFTDCTHLHEPDCALRAAVAEGSIAASRYESYRRILAPRLRSGSFDTSG